MQSKGTIWIFTSQGVSWHLREGASVAASQYQRDHNSAVVLWLLLLSRGKTSNKSKAISFMCLCLRVPGVRGRGRIRLCGTAGEPPPAVWGSGNNGCI